MPLDPLESPIAFLTDHSILSPEAEAALIAAMLAGVRVRQGICRVSSVDKRAVLQQEETAAELGWRPQQLAQLEAVTQEALSLNAKVRDTNDRTELGDTVPDQRFDPEAAAFDTSLRRDLSRAMKRLLSEREQRFVRAYFGFGTGQPATLGAVGAAEGLTRERVRQVIAGAIAKLRNDTALAAYRTLPAD